MAVSFAAKCLVLLMFAQRSICRELHTTEIKEDARMQCPSSARSIYTVPSEMQCYQRCLKKDKCEVLNYKESATKNNCEVFDVESQDLGCTETPKAKWKTVTMKRKEERNTKVYESCKDIREGNPKAKNGTYNLKSGKHYCVMESLEKCGEGGWTLAMKINGSKDTFQISSSYWKNNITYNVENGLKSFQREEAKFPAFSSLAFTSICLGMKRNDKTKWLHITKSESSLLKIFKNDIYQPTSLGRNAWMSMLHGAYLQSECNREGFNVIGGSHFRARIGIIGNNENDCNTPDSFIGFGSETRLRNSCGSTNIPVIGYILIK